MMADDVRGGSAGPGGHVCERGTVCAAGYAKDGEGCCPYENAVCCDNKQTCCPHGSTCETSGQLS